MPKNVLPDSINGLTRTRITVIIRCDSSVLSITDQDKHFDFLTSAMDTTALEVALLFKNGWSAELFFKWVKQHLKIKKF